MSDNIKVLELNASDNQYLHKDFHGALCYSIKYLDETYGPQAAVEYLRQVALNAFSPLIADLKKNGLSALERHFSAIFKLEQGICDFRYDGDTLVLTVSNCPAVEHLRKKNLLYTDRFCLTTVVVNETICSAAGFACSCDYQPGAGKCVQKFWKPAAKKA